MERGFWGRRASSTAEPRGAGGWVGPLEDWLPLTAPSPPADTCSAPLSGPCMQGPEKFRQGQSRQGRAVCSGCGPLLGWEIRPPQALEAGQHRCTQKRAHTAQYSGATVPVRPQCLEVKSLPPRLPWGQVSSNKNITTQSSLSTRSVLNAFCRKCCSILPELLVFPF